MTSATFGCIGVLSSQHDAKHTGPESENDRSTLNPDWISLTLRFHEVGTRSETAFAIHLIFDLPGA